MVETLMLVINFSVGVTVAVPVGIAVGAMLVAR
jgi:hypothetical protein